jgi:hypothetical protein
LTPIGVVGGVRGVFFAGIGGAWFKGQQTTSPCAGESNDYKFFTNNSTACLVPTGIKVDPVTGNPITNLDPATGVQTPVLNYSLQRVDGFRLQDGRASYGIGLETFALGFPIHFDWSWRTMFNNGWENAFFACVTVNPVTGQCVSGAEEFRKPRFAVWIGYDF